MFLALLIVALLTWLIWRSRDGAEVVKSTPASIWWTLACIFALLAQILFGTQVREAVDAMQNSVPRAGLLSAIGKTFSIHRSFSWIVLILHVGLMVDLYKTQGLKPFPLTVILLILGTISTGAAMAYFAIPPWLQPTHLLLATGCFGILFMLMLRLKGNVNEVIVN
jgi:cytochrome c oxidase assembly protein subunit 15